MGWLDRILGVFKARPAPTQDASPPGASPPGARVDAGPKAVKAKPAKTKPAKPKAPRPERGEKRSKKARKGAERPAPPQTAEVLSVEEAERRYGDLVRKPPAPEVPKAPVERPAPPPRPVDPAEVARRAAADDVRHRARLPRFGELLSRTDALIAVEAATLRDLASARQGLVEGWARLGDPPQPEADDLIARRDACLAALDERIGAAQAAAAAVYGENLDRKRAIVEEARALAEREDLRGAGPAMGDLRARLRAVGPVAPADAEAVAAAFASAEDRLKARQGEQRAARDAAREEGIARLTQLAQQAETLAAAPDKEVAAQRIIALQATWKTLHVPGDTAAVWARFRAACDAVFAARTQARLEASKVAIERLEQIVQRAEMLAEGGVDGDPEREIDAAMTAWKRVGRAPRDAQQALWERLVKAFDGMRAPPADLSGQDASELTFRPFEALVPERDPEE